MKINFISNYINHHQIPFCDCLYRKLGRILRLYRRSLWRRSG